MNENVELMEQIYEDASMASFSLEQTLQDLKDKDNKIKDGIEDILKGYERYVTDSKEYLLQNGVEAKETGFMTKMGAKMGIKKEVLHDNSDSSIAEMLIQGIQMGSLDMEKKISSYKDKVEKEVIKLAEDFKTFSEENIEAFKKYL